MQGAQPICLALLVRSTGAVWTAEDLIPLLSNAVEAQFSTLARRFGIELHHEQYPSFRTLPMEPFRKELQGFIEDVWTAEEQRYHEFHNEWLDPKEVYDASNEIVGSPQFRATGTDHRLDFELDATKIASVFQGSLETALAPLKNLLNLEKSSLSESDSSFESFSNSNTVEGSGLREYGDDTIALSFGGTSFVGSLAGMLARKDVINKFITEAQEQLVQLGLVWPALERFARVMDETAPLYRQMLPLTLDAAYRGLAAMYELTPSRVNVRTFIPALVELATVSTAYLYALEAASPVERAGLSELQWFIGNVTTFLPHLQSFIGTIIQALPIAGSINPRWMPLAIAGAGPLEVASSLIPDLVEWLEAYRQACPRLVSILAITAGVGTDASLSLEASLVRFEHEGKGMLDIYDNPDRLLLFLGESLLTVLRAVRTPNRLIELREHVAQIRPFMDASYRFLDKAGLTAQELSESVLPMLRLFPPRPMISRLTAGFLLQVTMIGPQLSSIIIPDILHMINATKPFFDFLQAPVANTLIIVPTITTLISTGMHTIPAVVAILPPMQNLLNATRKLVKLSRPTLKAVVSLLSLLQEVPLPARQGVMEGMWHCLETFPRLFTSPSLQDEDAITDQ